MIGYGIQGKAQAANARDSGLKVIVGTRSPEVSPSRAQAKADGFEAMSIAEATRKADLLLIELADPAQPSIYQRRNRSQAHGRQDALLLSRFQRAIRRNSAHRRT